MDSPEEPIKPDPQQSAEFLTAEYRHMADSFWENEKLGDRRVNFHITLTAAVIAASVALLKLIGSLTGGSALLLLPGLMGLFLFGWITLNRLIRRNVVTDEYNKFTARFQPWWELYFRNDPTRAQSPIGTGP